MKMPPSDELQLRQNELEKSTKIFDESMREMYELKIKEILERHKMNEEKMEKSQNYSNDELKDQKFDSNEKIKHQKNQNELKDQKTDDKSMKNELRCKKCQKKFETKTNLENHKCVECKICGNFYHTVASLKIHLRASHHDELNLELYTCDFCGIKKKYKPCMENHILKIHSKTVQHFKCVKCPKTFATKLSLYSHSQTHIFKNCKICDKTITSKHLTRHMRNVHRTVGSFSCAKCNKMFKNQTHFNRHKHHQMIQHTKDRIFKFNCDRCDFTTNALFNIKNHENVHKKRDERRRLMPNGFDCRKCDAIFKTKENRNEHERRVHATHKLKCEMCGNLFKGIGSLKAHSKKFH